MALEFSNAIPLFQAKRQRKNKKSSWNSTRFIQPPIGCCFGKELVRCAVEITLKRYPLLFSFRPLHRSVRSQPAGFDQYFRTDVAGGFTIFLFAGSIMGSRGAFWREKSANSPNDSPFFARKGLLTNCSILCVKMKANTMVAYSIL